MTGEVVWFRMVCLYVVTRSHPQSRQAHVEGGPSEVEYVKGFVFLQSTIVNDIVCGRKPRRLHITFETYVLLRKGDIYVQTGFHPWLPHSQALTRGRWGAHAEQPVCWVSAFFTETASDD